VSISSWFVGAGVVASVIGNAAVTATINGALPLHPISIASWFVGAGVVASVIGNAAVTATIAGVANVVASVAGQAAVYPYQPTYPNMQFTNAIINVNGSGVVAANSLASNARPIALMGYQIISNGTVVLAFYDGTINAPLTGSLSLVPNSGLVVGPSPFPICFTSSGRGLTIGLSASCNIGGAIQYYLG
jgi:hypothetical protein